MDVQNIYATHDAFLDGRGLKNSRTKDPSNSANGPAMTGSSSLSFKSPPLFFDIDADVEVGWPSVASRASVESGILSLPLISLFAVSTLCRALAFRPGGG